MSRGRPHETLREGLTRMVAVDTARHYVNHPAHAHQLLVLTCGMLDSLRQAYPDDPALAAPLLLERLPGIAGNISKMFTWARAVNEAYPDDIPSEGARLCS